MVLVAKGHCFTPLGAQDAMTVQDDYIAVHDITQRKT